MEYRLTPRARDDLISIANYTQQQWGTEQRNAYLIKLEQRFSWLAEYPRLGTHRPDSNKGYFCFPEGQHLVFYLIKGKVIYIIGIPHKEMDVVDYFISGDPNREP